MHVLSRYGSAGTHASVATRYGAASVHCVPQLSGTRTENQPEGPLQNLRRTQDHAAEEDSGGSRRQRCDLLSLYLWDERKKKQTVELVS